MSNCIVCLAEHDNVGSLCFDCKETLAEEILLERLAKQRLELEEADDSYEQIEPD